MTTQVQEKKVGTVAPVVDILEREDAVVITADLPGVELDKLDIDVKDNVLTLRGGRTPPGNGEGYKRLHRDVYPIAYLRSFNLPGEFDQDHIQATLKNGVLTLVLPKAEKAQLRKIPVQAET